ncbi:hypothetical protein FF011L_16840 [Roseimaritima multifibrata]|uniref:Uncharacterized protein n=1 Tax=Roseimaritima multifibrata TaxID=1930274 RepID=A0A517MDG2_9BACT|nr:hypothetical protein [Roseimaritima multifibrata]QDS92929.1 hypothetical protein FF011L_16840 [Roseimaritima multifibrata]
MTTIKWTHSAPGSVLYAAGAVALNRPISDPEVDALLIGPVTDINSQIGSTDLELTTFWEALIAAGFEDSDDPKRCEQALAAAGCSPLALDTLARAVAGKLTEIRLAYNERFPKLAEQLPLRGRPLQTAWDERGRGMLVQIGQQTHADLLPKKVEIRLVQPVSGGGGYVDFQHQAIWVEAMLTNVDPQVPELLRIAWLVARLGIGQGGANRMVEATHLPVVAALGLIPIVLQAGQNLDLVPPGELPIQRTLDLWQQGAAPATTLVLQDWWRQVNSGSTPFPVALKALDRMLASE